MSRYLYLVIFIVLYVNGSFAMEKGLPHEPDTTTVSLDLLAKGRQVQLNYDLNLPATQKLNHGAPSFVAVYEKTKGSDWVEIQKFDLNKVLTMNDEIRFKEMIALRNDDSEVAVHSTIYHCGKEHKTACYIQGYVGKTKRKSGIKNSNLDFVIEAHMK